VILEVIAGVQRLKKQKRFLYEYRQKMITTSLNSMDEFNELETHEHKKHKKKQKQEA
jgi:hypothetical protein